MYEPSGLFPQGVVIFFRLAGADGNLARSILTTGRAIMIGRGHGADGHEDDYIVLDGTGKPIGWYPRDYVAAILPLETTGPADNANNPPKPTRN